MGIPLNVIMQSTFNRKILLETVKAVHNHMYLPHGVTILFVLIFKSQIRSVVQCTV